MKFTEDLVSQRTKSIKSYTNVLSLYFIFENFLKFPEQKKYKFHHIFKISTCGRFILFLQRPKSLKFWFNFPKIQTLFDFYYRCSYDRQLNQNMTTNFDNILRFQNTKLFRHLLCFEFSNNLRSDMLSKHFDKKHL